MREIVTIQVGEFANYVGSHFWNFQDELLGLVEDSNSDPVFRNTNMDMDILYRTGETQQGLFTYCPRLISIGYQGSLGTLSSSGSLYGNASKSDSPDILTWKGGITKSISKPREKNLFLQSLSEEGEASSNSNPNSNPNLKIGDKERVESLEKDVKFWSDFSKVHFHPKSLYELTGTWTDPQNFNYFGAGKEIISEASRLEEINERLRFFLEECDHIQGIQFIVDDSGGFAGVASAFLENIADDYANVPVLLYSVRDPLSYTQVTTQKKLISKSLHDSVSLSKLSSFCNLFVPLGLPSLSHLGGLVSIKDEKLFYSSAVYASAIHSISVPFRLSPKSSVNFASGSLDIGEFTHVLSGRDRQNMVASLDISLPTLSFFDKGNRRDILSNFCTLTPEIGDDSDDLYAAESLVFNGALYSGQNRALISQVNDLIHSTYETLEIRPKSSHLAISLSPLPIPLPFPSIFSPSTGPRGETLTLENKNETVPPKGSLDVESVPIATRVRSSVAMRPFVENRSSNLFKYGIVRGARGLGILNEWGFAKDEVDEMGEHLSKILRNLDPELFENSSDSD